MIEPGRLRRAFEALQHADTHARACWVCDLDVLNARARRFRAAFSDLPHLAAYALKANALPDVLAALRAHGFGADAGSLGELEAAAAAEFAPAMTVLNGNGRTPEEAGWVARKGVGLVNADHVPELDLLEDAAARVGTMVRVGLRVNPGIETPGHHYVATGHEGAKFGIGPGEALVAWRDRARWPRLRLDGVHVHVGSQLLDPGPMARALDGVLALAEASADAGAPLGVINLGGGFGIDYSGAAEFPLEDWARHLIARVSGSPFAWVVEPGRWLVAPAGALVAEVLWVKWRGGRRFVVLAAGMNDLIRPALYGARHRITPLEPRPGEPAPAIVVGPVCESADVFDPEALLPPLERGDLVALHDAGAYGAVMSSNYNGRGRLAEVVVSAEEVWLARRSERPADLAARDQTARLPAR
jgi:diaminopimelate decarboxylase